MSQIYSVFLLNRPQATGIAWGIRHRYDNDGGKNNTIFLSLRLHVFSAMSIWKDLQAASREYIFSFMMPKN